MRAQMLNVVELRVKEVTEAYENKIMERVSKKDFNVNKAFFLEMNREAKSLASRAMSMNDNLQTKYENLDSFFAPRALFDELVKRVDKMETTLNEKMQALDYDSEDESQNNQSIDDVSGDLGNDDSKKKDDVKSRASL